MMCVDHVCTVIIAHAEIGLARIKAEYASDLLSNTIS